MREADREMLQFRICASLARADWALARMALLPPWALVRRYAQYRRAKLNLVQAELDEVLLREALERRQRV